MGRRRRLRKSDGGELEVNKRDVVVSYEVIPPIVVASDEAILDALLGPGVNPFEGSPNVKLRKVGTEGILPTSNSRTR